MVVVYYPPTLVRLGLVRIGNERMPQGDKDRREIVDDMPVQVSSWIAYQVARLNGLVEEPADRPTGSGG